MTKRKLTKTVQEFLRTTAGRHTESPGQDATAQMPHPKPPADKPHVRADTATPFEYKLEKGVAKKIAPYNPKPRKSEAREWVHPGDPEHRRDGDVEADPNLREALPRHEGPIRFRGFNKLARMTQSRINHDTGEVEFLLHRGMSADEYKKHRRGTVGGKSSWTPHLKIAQYFARHSGSRVASSWVPESHIHNMPFMEGHDPEVREYSHEGEVVVTPHQLNLVTTGRVKSALPFSVERLKDLNDRLADAKITGEKKRSELRAKMKENLAPKITKSLASVLEKGVAKKIAPYNPKPGSSAVGEWVKPALGQYGEPKKALPASREDLPRHEGPIRFRGLNKLARLTQSRRNPETGEREFLLHRGMGQDEHQAHGKGGVRGKTSWTPHVDIAKEFAPYRERGDAVLSAWVPESHIHSMPFMEGHDANIRGVIKEEKEVVVDPHKFDFTETPLEMLPNKRLHVLAGDYKAGDDTKHQNLRRKMKENLVPWIKKSLASVLEKGAARKLAPYDPRTEERREDAVTWAKGGGGSKRDALPRHEGPARFRGLNKLMGETKSRRNPETGELEFLLHRGMGEGETGKHLRGKIDSHTSWTPNQHTARDFAQEYSGDAAGSVISAWVPERHLHNFVYMLGEPTLGRRVRAESEVVVSPHDFTANIEDHQEYPDWFKDPLENIPKTKNLAEVAKEPSFIDAHPSEKRLMLRTKIKRNLGDTRKHEVKKSRTGRSYAGGVRESVLAKSEPTWSVRIKGRPGSHKARLTRSLGPTKGLGYVLESGEIVPAKDCSGVVMFSGTRNRAGPNGNTADTTTHQDFRLEKGQNGDWRLGDYAFKHTREDDALHGISVHTGDGKRVGTFQFWRTPQGLEPSISQVHPDHRRKGIASEAYRLAEHHSGLKMVPASVQTADAAKLWAQPERKFGKSSGNMTDADRETARINENKKTVEAQKPHKFKAAHWTHPNGHPRCILCGDEEHTGGMCSGTLTKSDTYSNWRKPTDEELGNEYSWEYRHVKGSLGDIFPSKEHFLAAAKAGKIMPMPDRVSRATNIPDIEGVKDLVSNYQYPRDVDRIVQGLTEHAPMPTPIVIKHAGGHFMMGGNTRQNLARIHGAHPHVLVVDADHLKKSALQKGVARKIAPYNPTPIRFKKSADLAKSGRPLEVSSVAVIDPHTNSILMGRRSDSGRWTMPGGHSEPGESALVCAMRELREEVGVVSRNLIYLGSERIRCEDGKVRVIHAFVMYGRPGTTGIYDPDEEVQRWMWVPFTDRLPAQVERNLHSPKNVTLKLLGLQK